MKKKRWSIDDIMNACNESTGLIPERSELVNLQRYLNGERRCMDFDALTEWEQMFVNALP